jgi:hypothetical protein
MKHHALISAVMALMAAGCTSTASIDEWQKSIEVYVDKHADGDPGVLRDMTWSESHRGFSLISDEWPTKSTDVNGVLLGFKPVGNRRWFVYLVGLSKEQKLEDIRLAALSTDEGKNVWAMAKADAKTLQIYQQYQDGAWKKLFEKRDKAPTSYAGFPCENDYFELTVEGNALAATHPASGARWTVALP